MSQSKSIKSNLYFVRVDGNKSYLKDKCQILSSGLDVVRCIAGYHTGKTGENPHIHICIELNSNPQKQSFAVRIKKLFEIEKKSNYSLAIWDGKDGEGAISYLYHEESMELLVNKGFTDAQLAVAKKANDAVQAVVAVNSERASNKLVTKALARFEGESPSKVDILTFMLYAIKEGENYHPGMYKIKSYVEEVELKLSTDVSGLAWTYYKSLWRD